MRTLILLFVAILSLTSCVHEFPEENAVVGNPLVVACKVKVHLSLDSLTLYKEINTTRAANGRLQRNRFVIEVYPEGENEPVFHQIFYREANDTSAFTIPMTLEAQRYNIVAWHDYVDESDTNPFYTIDNLRNIHVPAPARYIGNTDAKDCQSLIAELDLTPYAGQWYVDVTKTYQMTRPLAKIVFITTDLDNYIEKQESTKDIRGSESKGEELRSVLNKYKTKIVYTAYLPTGFNALGNRPNDSEVGYSCDASLTVLDNGEVCMAFDYILINTHETYVDAALYVYDENGEEVTHTEPIHFPIKRNGITVLRDKFFTKTPPAGVTIQPEFDGEFNIYI